MNTHYFFVFVGTLSSGARDQVLGLGDWNLGRMQKREFKEREIKTEGTTADPPNICNQPGRRQATCTVEGAQF